LDSNRRDFTINCIYYFSTGAAKKTKASKKNMSAKDLETLVE
jgi:tRNA nucleotidyltransferase/poly(A) polymerase